MKVIIKLSLLLLLIACNQEKELPMDLICLSNVNVIDVDKGLLENQNIYLSKDKIYKLKDSSTDKIPETAIIINGDSKYIMPGLWDAHVHFAYIEEMAPAMFDLFLVNGITSVRDTGGKISFVKEWQEKARANPDSAPRVMIAGPLLDGEPNVYDGSDAQHPELSVGLEDEEAVITQIELLDSVGVDLLKAYEMLTPDQFAMITNLAREKNLKVTGHVPLSMDVRTASTQGLNSMEHMRNLEISCASNWEELLSNRRKLLEQGKNGAGAILRTNIHNTQRPEAIENYSEAIANEVLDVLKENDTWQIPTLTLNTLFSGRYFAQEDWTEYYKYLPDSIEREWVTNSMELAKAEVAEFRKNYDNWLTLMVGKIHKKGIPIMAGTDTPIAFLTPGLSLHEELKVLADAGLTNLEVLKTATINPAKYFGLEKELGKIAEGYIADLILLDENPLEDITNTQKIFKVFKNGVEIDIAARNANLKSMQ